MGLAIIVPGVNYSGPGKVTLTGSVPVTAFIIRGADSVNNESNTEAYHLDFTPNNTTQRSVTWSVVSGSAYASINSSTGVLTVLSGANSDTVVIRATSQADNTIYADKTLTVTYYGSSPVYTPLEDLTARIYFNTNAYCLTDLTPQTGWWYKMKVAPQGSGLKIFMGYRNRSNSDDDTVSVEQDNTGLNYGALRCKMYGTRYTSSSAVANQTRYVIEAKPSGVSVSPSLGTFSSDNYSYNSAGNLAIGAMAYASGVGYANGYIDFFGLEIFDSNDQLIHRLIPQSDTRVLDEVTGTYYPCTGTVIYADDE